jgi:high-affinity iron transporter
MRFGAVGDNGSMVGNHSVHRRPIATGAAAGFMATIITWFVAVGIVSNLLSIRTLDLQAAAFAICIGLSGIV